MCKKLTGVVTPGAGNGKEPMEEDEEASSCSKRRRVPQIKAGKPEKPQLKKPRSGGTPRCVQVGVDSTLVRQSRPGRDVTTQRRD